MYPVFGSEARDKRWEGEKGGKDGVKRERGRMGMEKEKEMVSKGGVNLKKGGSLF